MIIDYINNDYSFDVQNLCLLFFPRESFTESSGRHLSVTLGDGSATAVFETAAGVYKGSADINRKLYDAERAAVKRACFNVLCDATGTRPPWGLLTGIRPVTLYLKLRRLYGTEADSMFENEYLVSSEKHSLVTETVRQREKYALMADPSNYSLYISVPFCPSRCRYCSFVSAVTEREHKLMPEYTEILCRELVSKAEEMKNKKLLSVYMGGGTPTTLSPELLDRILSTVSSRFDTSGLIEFTVEAGRPDTITEAKLDVLRKNGVGRVSVNPQTMNDDVLRLAGRRHTVADFISAYDLVSSYGFSVNTDFIAGLPGETSESFRSGIEQIVEMAPDNITVHALYVKRASDYGGDEGKNVSDDPVCGMVSDARNICADNGYLPYYIYRQKNTADNCENVGYAKPGRECAYNIFMMDEIQTVVGCGANAMTKYVGEGTIDRVSNTKYAYNYVAGAK